MRTMLAKTCRGLAVLAAAAIITLVAGAAQAAQTVGPVTDDLGVVRIPKGAPIIIGGYWVISGPDTAMGIDSKRGAELYFKSMGDKLLGHPIKFTVEDDLCSAEGGQTAATKLAANPQIFVVLGGAAGLLNVWRQVGPAPPK